MKFKDTLNEDVVDDVALVVKTYDKPKTRRLLTAKVINKLKEKRNNSKSSSNKQKLQKIIDKLEKDYKKGKFIKENINERYKPNLESKGWEAAQKVIRQLQSSVFRKLDDDELLEFRKAIADAFNLDGILRETTINERKGGMDVIRRIVKNHQFEKGVDVQTANYILNVYNKVDSDTKKIMDKVTLNQLTNIILKSRK